MKKILFTIICFMLFNTSCFAYFDTVNISIKLNEDGSAHFKESIKGNDTININYGNLIVKDIKFNNKKTNKDEFEIENKATLEYTVENYAIKFNDAIGIIFKMDNKIKELHVMISSEVPFNENNTAIYLMGNDSKVYFEKGAIHLKDKDVSKYVALTSFIDMEFTSYNKIKKNIKDVYESYNVNKLDEYMNILKIVLIVIVVCVLFALIIIKIINKDNKLIVNGKIMDYEEVSYYDEVPFSNDLYQIYFFASELGLLKNRSNIVGAIIFKFIMEDKLEFKKNKLYTKDVKNFDNKLDEGLYQILISASKDGYFTQETLKSYLLTNPLRIKNWYQKVSNYNYNLLVKKGKKYIVSERIVREYNNLLGFKKYLIFFNQVPRKNKLTVKKYQNMILASIVLGIDSAYAEEILRKNNENIYAKTLLKFEKTLYNYIYDIVRDE